MNHCICLGLFVYDNKSDVYWFSQTNNNGPILEMYHLVGVLMGLAVYNGVQLSVRFPPCAYRKLLSPPIVPINNPNAIVGVGQVTLDDLKQVLPVKFLTAKFSCIPSSS